jgi:hypothetical protein
MFRACIIPLLVVFSVAAAAAQPSLGKTFELKVGEWKIVGPEGLTVGFDGILDDSRCPIGLYCIWEGDAAADIWAEMPSWEKEKFLLHAHRGFDWYAQYGDYEIALVAVNPYPVLYDPIPPDEYVVTVVVSGGPAPAEDSTWGRIKALYGTR